MSQFENWDVGVILLLYQNQYKIDSMGATDIGYEVDAV